MSGAVAVQAVVVGLANGAVYGLVALGFSLVYSLTRVLSLAHGDLVAGSLTVGVLLVLGRAPAVSEPDLLRSAALVVITLGAGALLAAALYLLAVRPFAGGASRPSVLGWVAASVVLGLVVRQSLAAAFPRDATAVPDPLRLGAFARSGVVSLPGGGSVPARLLGVLVIGVAAGALVEVALVRSRLGKAMRAVADDGDAATLVGVPRERVVLLAFVVAGLLTGLAALLGVPGRALAADTGVLLGLKAIAAALLWRLGSLTGALVGGLVLGVVESLAVNSELLGPGYSDVLALGVLVVLLAVRPEGLRAAPRRPVL